MLELALMIINMIAFLVPNIYLMACPCCVNVNSAIAWTAFVRWTCWNTVCWRLSGFCSRFGLLIVTGDSNACSCLAHITNCIFKAWWRFARQW